MPKSAVLTLPKADEYGNFWLRDYVVRDVCILRGGSPEFVKSARVGKRRWFISTGDAGGVQFSGTEIRYYDSPELALKALAGLLREK